jgi:amino acid adenylation domain-containing protein
MLRETLTKDPTRHIEQVVVDFEEGTCLSQVEQAWRGTVAATEALRGRFEIHDGEALGFRSGEGEVQWRTLSEEPQDWDRWLEEDRRTPLPLAEVVPWRVTCWEQSRRWVWTFHHALLDGRSITSVVQSFLKRLTGGDPGPLALPERIKPDENAVAEAITFHRAQAAEAEPMLAEFPDDLKTPARVRQELGAAMAFRLEQAAERLQVTAPTLLAWAWGQALAATAGADCAAIGQVRSGAPQASCAGFSMHTVPLVIPRAREGSLADHVCALRAKLLAMRRIEHVPVEVLPDLFPSFPGNPWPGGVLMVETGTLHQRAGDFPQVRHIRLHESGGGGLLASAYLRPELLLEVETDGVSIGPFGAQSLLDHWARIVSRLADGAEETDDAATLTQIPTAGEGQHCWEDGGTPVAETSIPQLWASSVSRFGGLTALEADGRSFDYQSLDTRVRELAGHLLARGVKKGEPVASLLEDRGQLPIVMLALARIGGVHVPLDPALPQERLKTLLFDSSARFLISQESRSGLEGVAVISPRAMPTSDFVMPTEDVSPEDLLALLYTSGSTGQPKGVKLTHGGVANEVVAMAKLVELGPGDRLLQFASPGFDAALEEIFATLASGATLIPRPNGIASDLQDFHRFLETSGITVLDLTTAFWAEWCAWMAEETQQIPPKIRAVIVGGERLSAGALADWQRCGGERIPLVNSYGPTEASIVATAEILNGPMESGDPPIGRPLPGVIARVADAKGARLSEGAAGELWLGGYGLSPGYWRRPERTEARFVTIKGQRFYRTGDRVYRDAAGRLRFLGRIDTQLKIRGQRVEPEEVKRAVESFPGVGTSHVALSDGHLAAWVKWSEPAPEGWPGLIAQHLSRLLPAAAMPVRWARVEIFPLTERGKMDPSALPPATLTAGRSLHHEAPATAAERRIAELWEDLLEVRNIGRDDSFFDLGGHSLAALRLFAILSREWQVRVPMASLVQAPTPRLLAEFLEQGASGADAPLNREPVVVPIRAEGGLSPLFCIHGGDGGVIFYRNMSIHLPAGRPLLAIESPALGAHEEVRVVPVEQCAADYVQALRRHQPQGPYHLAGYSYGGLLVYEMAAQLIAAGEEVGFAALFDTVNPAAPVREYSLMERAEVYWNSQQSHPWFERILRVGRRIREGIATHLRVRNEIRTARGAGATEPHSEIRMLQVREAHWNAMEAYRPGRLACQLTLFRTRVADDKYDIPSDYGWGDLVDSLEIVEVAGRHLTMFEPRHAAGLAKEIAARI